MWNQFTTLADYEKRDPWWEARQVSAEYSGSRFINTVSSVVSKIFGRKLLPQYGTLESVMTVDLNSYRPDINVEMLIDQGVRVFMLRVICPGRWEFGNWQYFVDSTFTLYHKRIRDYAKAKNIKVWIIGYGVHNPWMDEDYGYNSPVDEQVKMLKEATRNHLCDMYAWDDEVAECWKNGQNTIMTPVNLLKSISRVMSQSWTEFERNPDGTHKMIVHYSANWYMKKYAQTGYTVWLDNANKDVNTRTMMTWRAWIPLTISGAYDTIRMVFDQFINPTGIQENNYLRLGTNLAADIWQGCFTATGPWCPKKTDGTYKYGIDASISYGPSATISQFVYNANLSYSLVDSTAPSVPGSIASSFVSPDVIVTWSPSTDDVGVVAYRIMKDNVVLGTTTELSFSDSVVEAGKTYTYSVSALDQAGNRSAEAVTSITIPSVPPPPPGDGTYLTTSDFNVWVSNTFQKHTHNSGPPVVK
jgi:hypothetical protein